MESSRDRARRRTKEIGEARGNYNQRAAITPKQLKLIEDLLIECCMSERAVRNGYLSRETGRDIRFIDSLYSVEASQIIGKLIDQRDRGREEGSMARQQDEDTEDADWNRR